MQIFHTPCKYFVKIKEFDAMVALPNLTILKPCFSILLPCMYSASIRMVNTLLLYFSPHIFCSMIGVLVWWKCVEIKVANGLMELKTS